MSEQLTPEVILGAADELAAIINRQLDDFHATSITLTRDQAIISLGLITGAIEQLRRETSGQ